MIARREILTLLGSACVWPATASAQAVRPVPRIGYVTQGALELERLWLAAFLQGLRDLAYVDGQNIIVEQRHAEERAERSSALIADLVRLKVDVLVATDTTLALIAKQATTSIPIVMTAADPVGSGVVSNLARPGGNITGLSDYHADLVTKRLQLLKELSPAMTGLAVLMNPANASNVRQLDDVRAVAPGMGIEVVAFHVQAPGDMDRAFGSIRQWLRPEGPVRRGAILVVADRATTSQRSRIAAFALENRLPTVSAHKLSVVAGGLLSYGSNFNDQYRRLAVYVHRILSGARAGDMLIEQPTKFELAVNLKTARTLGLTIPPALFARADEVIE